VFMTPKLYEGHFLTLVFEGEDDGILHFDLADLKGTEVEHVWMDVQAKRKSIRAGVDAARSQLFGCKAITNVNYNLDEVMREMEKVLEEYLWEGVQEHVRAWFGITARHEVSRHELNWDHWLCYLSADGYMDRTDTVLYCTLEEAKDELDSMYSIIECSECGWVEADENGCPEHPDKGGENEFAAAG